MPDINSSQSAALASSIDGPRIDPRTRLMLEASPFPLLLRLASPNAIAFFLQAGVSMAEVWYIGQLGTSSLASIALVFPLLMLMQMMSAGAFGGGVTSAIARSLGAGNVDKANSLVWHGVIIASIAAGFFLVFHLLLGRGLLVTLGGEGKVLSDALSYINVLFAGAILLWLMNTFSAVFRGMGNMRFPAALMMIGALIQVPLSGALILGWGGLPQLGILGAVVSTLIVASMSLLVLVIRLSMGSETLVLSLKYLNLTKDHFAVILRVALPASLAPVLTVLSVLVLTGLVGRFGAAALAGFGIGSRLEFLMVPMVFGIGAALTAMVGVNVGAGNLDRAEKIGWMGGSFAALLTGVIGCVTAIWPELWVGLYTSDPAAFQAGCDYMRVVGPFYALQGLGLALFFASQGAGKVFWPVLATIVRFVLTAGGASMAILVFDGAIHHVYYYAAAGMVIYGLGTGIAIKLGAWRR